MVSDLGNAEFEFCLFARDAREVVLAGDFTGWIRGAIRLNRRADGWWSARIHVPTGNHLFSYVINGDTWRPDYAAHGIQRNPYGGWVSCLWVAEPTRRVQAINTRSSAANGSRLSRRFAGSARHDQPGVCTSPPRRPGEAPVIAEKGRRK
jgi:1,4-alpha-glucan branching enzyme